MSVAGADVEGGDEEDGQLRCQLTYTRVNVRHSFTSLTAHRYCEIITHTICLLSA